MKRLTLGVGTAFLFAVAAAGFALAQTAPGNPSGQHRFIAAAADSTGAQKRHANRRADMIEAADQNADGVLDLNELNTAMVDRAQTQAQNLMTRFDSNADGLLSAEELQVSRSDRRFDRLDEDGDGQISKSEFREARGHKKEAP